MVMKLVYLFDANGIYTGIYSAQQSPLEPGIFIVPELSTDIAPPGAAGTWPVFKNGVWVSEPDHRGETHYDANGNPVVIVDLGPVPLTLLPTPPILPPKQVTSVSMRQAQLALVRSGLFLTVDTSIQALPGMAGDEARVWWRTSTSVDRNNPLVAQITTSLNITSAQLDALFTLASTL
jgi:hypothetical protein